MHVFSQVNTVKKLFVFVASRRRADSHNGSLQDIRNSYTYPGEHESDIQKHKSATQYVTY